MKYIKKTSFKHLSDLIYTLNHIPCEEKKKTIKVSDLVYHILLSSDKLYKKGDNKK
jgi:hypothetical protein